MIPWQYAQLAQSIHQEHIQAAFTPRPEWPVATRTTPSPRQYLGRLRKQVRRSIRWVGMPRVPSLG
jgi:hypothetical protein